MEQPELIQRKTELSEQVVHFCRYLREKGLRIGPGKTLEALKALDVVPLDKRDNFRLALRTALTHSPEEQLRFDDLYLDYWRNIQRAIDSKNRYGDPKETAKKKEQPPDKQQTGPPLLSIQNWLEGTQSEEETALAAFSSQKVLTEVDFGSFGEDEMQEVLELIRRMARTLALRYRRRQESAYSGNRPDIPRTLRHNLRRGGEMLDLFYRKKKLQHMDLVMLCDVSKSMDIYSRFLVQFIYAFQQHYRSVETFVFATSLHNISRQLKASSFSTALRQLSGVVNDWSGGTRIGESLETFVQHYGRKHLKPRTLVLIMSDGWDTGDTDRLSSAMAEIHKKSAGVMWLNPLAGRKGYSPEVKGMEAAMPYIDLFAPAHNVESLRKAAVALERFRKRKTGVEIL